MACSYAPVFWMALVSFVIDCLQGKPGITIFNCDTKLACDSSTVLTCNVTEEPFLSMYWYVNGSIVGECSRVQCFPTTLLPQYFTLSVDNITDKTFYLEIDPITIDDNIEVFCTDGIPSDSLKIFSKNVISKDKFSITNVKDGDAVTLEVFSNCVDRANEVTFTLNTKNDTERSFDDVIKSTTLSVMCTDQENPNCGGSATNKANHNITIQTDSSGFLYTFNLKISYEGVEIVFEEIGSYHIKNGIHDAMTHYITLDTTSSSEAQTTTTTTTTPAPPPPVLCWCLVHWILCLIFSVAGICMLSVGCIIMCSRCIGQDNCIGRACLWISECILALWCCKEQDNRRNEHGDRNDANNGHELDAKKDNTSTSASDETNIHGQRPLGSHSKTGKESSHRATPRNNKLEPIHK